MGMKSARLGLSCDVLFIFVFTKLSSREFLHLKAKSRNIPRKNTNDFYDMYILLKLRFCRLRNSWLL